MKAQRERLEAWATDEAAGYADTIATLRDERDQLALVCVPVGGDGGHDVERLNLAMKATLEELYEENEQLRLVLKDESQKAQDAEEDAMAMAARTMRW